MLNIFGKNLNLEKIFINFINITGVITVILNFFYHLRFGINFLNYSTYIGFVLMVLSVVLR